MGNKDGVRSHHGKDDRHASGSLGSALIGPVTERTRLQNRRH